MNPIKKRKIQKTLRETKNRRSLMTCKVIECKVDKSTLSKSTLEFLNKLFLESKWLYNSILSSKNIGSYDTKTTSVKVKVLDKFEKRSLENISAQMKQGIKTRIFSSLSTLSALKAKGYKTGKLKFKREVKCIPLKQHTQTFTIFRDNKRIKIQGLKNPLKVNGLNQLPETYEVGNANLVKSGKDFYVKITIFTTKEVKNVPNQSIGIDFGCTTQLTLSNGEKIEYQVPINARIKKLDQALARKVKGSKNRYKALAKREKAYQNLTNKRKEIKNQIVNKLVKNYKTICFQDESIESWKRNGHGKKIQFSAIGGIISALQRKAVTPMVVGKYYPSTQICSKCSNKQKMKQNKRTYLCKSCGATFDRDINSAINIEQEGLRLTINKIPRESREFKPVEMRTSSAILKTKLPKVQSVKQETPTSLVLG
jgi:transposase